jgi:hypothetical protein
MSTNYQTSTPRISNWHERPAPVPDWRQASRDTGDRRALSGVVEPVACGDVHYARPETLCVGESL